MLLKGNYFYITAIKVYNSCNKRKNNEILLEFFSLKKKEANK